MWLNFDTVQFFNNRANPMITRTIESSAQTRRDVLNSSIHTWFGHSCQTHLSWVENKCGPDSEMGISSNFRYLYYFCKIHKLLVRILAKLHHWTQQSNYWKLHINCSLYSGNRNYTGKQQLNVRLKFINPHSSAHLVNPLQYKPTPWREAFISRLNNHLNKHKI